MKTIILMRHAKAEKLSRPNQRDFDRALDQRGLAQAQQAVEFILEHAEVHPAWMISSPARRTRQTARPLVDAFDIPPSQWLEAMDLYLGEVDHWLTFLRDLPASTDHVFCVGHNPTISELAHVLSGQFQEMKTAEVYQLQLEQLSDWADLGPHSAQLHQSYRPRS